MTRQSLLIIPALLLLAAGCQKTTEQSPPTQLTLSIYHSGVVQYDSVLASASHNGQVFWQGRLTLNGNYYQVVLEPSPGSGYSAAGWVWADSVRCFTGATQTFNLADGEIKYMPINLVAQLPNAPYDLNATTISSTQINMVWSDTSALSTGYAIERGRASRDSLVEVAELPKYSFSYQNTGLDHNTWYYFRLRSYNPAGYSAYSNLDSARTDP